MERLTRKELYDGKVCFTKCAKINCPDKCAYCDIPKEANAKLKEYEDLEEQGKILKLPCTAGNKVYRIAEFIITEIQIFEDEILFFDDSDNMYHVEDFGKTVFLTQEEAETALKNLTQKQKRN